jgi:hypothetical protein
MSRPKNGPDLDSKLLAAIRALAEANASLPEVIVLAANGTAMRADWAIRPENRFQMEEGCGFIMKVRLCGADGYSTRPAAKTPRAPSGPTATPRSQRRQG